MVLVYYKYACLQLQFKLFLEVKDRVQIVEQEQTCPVERGRGLCT